MMKNFLISGTQRTGSSALAEALGAHPSVACGWEWTQHVPWTRKLEVAERALAGDFSVLSRADQVHMAQVFDRDRDWLGFRRLFRSSNKWLVHPRFSPALWADRLEDHLAWLARRPDIHVIHVVRRDGVEWLKSKFVAEATKAYWGKRYPQVRVQIPPREAVARLRAKDWVDSRLATLASSNPYLRINYEDLLADQETVIAEALRFLKCDPSAPPVRARRLHRQSTGTAADYVTNLKELIATLERRGLLMAQFDQS